jgi:hypothetical protein
VYPWRQFLSTLPISIREWLARVDLELDDLAVALPAKNAVSRLAVATTIRDALRGRCMRTG